MLVALFGNPCLTYPNLPMNSSPEELAVLAERMYEGTLRYYGGLGLAAPQVGINKRLFIVDFNSLNLIPPLTAWKSDIAHLVPPVSPNIEVFLNSEIIEHSEDTEEMEEGCLSFPELWLPIRRYKYIVLNYNNLLGIECVLDTRNYPEGSMLARVIQHEHDHTQGVLFLKRATKSQREKRLYILRMYRELYRNKWRQLPPTVITPDPLHVFANTGS